MAMTLRYAHLSQEHKRKAVNLLNGLTTAKKDAPPSLKEAQKIAGSTERAAYRNHSPELVSI